MFLEYDGRPKIVVRRATFISPMTQPKIAQRP